jgi:hypothetical protein
MYVCARRGDVNQPPSGTRPIGPNVAVASPPVCRLGPCSFALVVEGGKERMFRLSLLLLCLLRLLRLLRLLLFSLPCLVGHVSSPVVCTSRQMGAWGKTPSIVTASPAGMPSAVQTLPTTNTPQAVYANPRSLDLCRCTRVKIKFAMISILLCAINRCPTETVSPSVSVSRRVRCSMPHA